jgi:virulence-associated protein VagC
MIWRSKEHKGKVFRVGDGRAVRIPDEFVLAGEEIIIRQEKDGIITIYPATEEGRRALHVFNPFAEETDDVESK